MFLFPKSSLNTAELRLHYAFGGLRAELVTYYNKS